MKHVVTIAIVLAALTAIGMIGNAAQNADKASAPSPPPPAQSVQEDPETKLREVIERTNGDYSKLTDQEKARLDGWTSNHGKQYFEIKTRQWKKDGRKWTQGGDATAPKTAP